MIPQGALLRGLLAVVGVLALAVAGCSKATRTVTLATTTSTRDSGLLDMLVPIFEKRTGIQVKVVAVGTGQALQLGRRGDADILLVHDRPGEDQFMVDGHGDSRRGLMWNDFVVVGPPSDPAGVREAPTVLDAFRRVEAAGSLFISRGDDSGTHRKEVDLWRRAKVEPRGDWYLRAGTGMGQVLRMAAEKRAYTLSDRATFLALRRGLDLVVAFEGDPVLRNPYGILVVSPSKHPGVHVSEARAFADFLFTPEIQDAIARFGVSRYGEPLFHVEGGGKRPGD